MKPPAQHSALDALALDHIHTLTDQQRQRSLVVTRSDGVHIWQNETRYVSFGSNDYLGLAAEANESRSMQGAGASRLLTGNHPAYDALEQQLAHMKGTQAALVCGSGYLANLAALQTILTPRDLVLLDKYAHACMIDGARLSGASVKRFAHNDTAHLERLLDAHRTSHQRCVIATETVFSMDGDCAPLDDLHALSQRYDAWLYTDDAHGFGVVEQSNPAVIQVGTLSKAVGGYGGYICASRPVINWLVQAARPVLFSTALPEGLLHHAAQALTRMEQEPQRRERVMGWAALLCDALAYPPPQSAIVPIMIGDNEKTMALHTTLKQHYGIYVPAIRPPTVPAGMARLRVSLSAAHTHEHVMQLINALHVEGVISQTKK